MNKFLKSLTIVSVGLIIIFGVNFCYYLNEEVGLLKEQVDEQSAAIVDLNDFADIASKVIEMLIKNDTDLANALVMGHCTNLKRICEADNLRKKCSGPSKCDNGTMLDCKKIANACLKGSSK